VPHCKEIAIDFAPDSRILRVDAFYAPRKEFDRQSLKTAFIFQPLSLNVAPVASNLIPFFLASGGF